MGEAIPLELIPDELKSMKGAEVPLGMLPDVLKTTEVATPWAAKYPHLAAVPPTLWETAKAAVPFGKYAGEEGRKELKGEFFPTGTTTDPKELKKIEQELMTGQKKPSPYESLAMETMSAAEWAAFPTAMRTTGAIATKFLPEGVTKFFTKPISRLITDTTWYRKMTIPERGMVVQSLDDMIGKGYTEGEILRKWDNPAWRKEAFDRRMKGEEIPSPEVLPTEPVKPIEPKKVAPISRIATPEPIKPIIKGQEVPLEMIPPEIKAEQVRQKAIMQEWIRKDMEEAAKHPEEVMPILGKKLSEIEELMEKGVSLEDALRQKPEIVIPEVEKPLIQPLPEEKVSKEAMPISKEGMERGITTSDQAQKALDDKIDALMKQGLTFEEASNHPETEVLFKIRNEIDRKDLGDWRKVALKDTGLPEEETKSAFESIGLGEREGSDLSVAMTAKGLREFSQDTLLNLKGLYNHFTEGKKDRTLSEFRWGGTADNPILQGSVINEDGMLSKWDEKALKKTEAVFNAIAKTQSLDSIDLSRMPRGISGGKQATPPRVETVTAPLEEVRPAITKDYLAPVMNRGSNASVLPEGILEGSETNFSDWLKRNQPLRKALTQWMIDNKRYSSGSVTRDLQDYLKERGYKGFPQDTFSQYLKDIRGKPLPDVKTGFAFPTEGIKAKPNLEGTPLMEGARKVEVEKVQQRLFREGQEREKKAGQAGFVRIPKPEENNFVTGTINKVKEKFKAMIEPFTFYKKSPPELQNAIRTDLIGGVRKLYAEREKHKISLFGGMDDAEISKSVEIIYARDELARQKIGKGNPDITLKEIEDRLKKLEKTSSPKEIAGADRWREVSNIYRNDLVRRGKLSEEDSFEDYARHYVIDYTPEWAPAVGIPAKLRRPFRGYTKRAFGTTKEYRQDAESLLDYLTEVDSNNMLEDFIINQAEKYDVTPTLDRDTKVGLFGTDKGGKVRSYAKPSRIYDINGERYRAYSPDKPFTKRIYRTEEGEMAMGAEKKTYLVPENIYNTFEGFSPKGSKSWYLINKATSYFKSSAILSVFPRYNINNLVGDTWMVALQHPEPFKLIPHIDDTISFLIKKPEKFTEFDKSYNKFLMDNDILGATFIRELPNIRATHNPLKWLLQKSQVISQFRESILRGANAKYLFEEMQKGNGETVRQSFDWINTKGLNTEEAMGKIAREILIDYEATSKTYNRVIRGFMFPFGRWYFKGSELMWKFAMKHPFKALGGLLVLPVLGMALNNRNDEIKKLEMQLPDEIRDGFHIVLGKTDDGRIRTWNMQTPQDALIGTKIFSIATNQANMYLNGEKTLQKATTDAIEHWGIKEAKGVAYLTTPVARFLKGLIDRKDPMDNQPIYPFMDVSKMTQTNKLWRDTLFFVKCMTPILSGYISETEGKLRPPDKALKEIFNKFAGLPALGVQDYNEKLEILFPDGKKLNYEEFKRVKKFEQKEAGILLEIKEDFIKSGMMPNEYLKSNSLNKKMEGLFELHREHLTEEVKISLAERILNEVAKDPTTLKFWYDNKIDNAKTDNEKIRLRKEQKEAKTFQMLEKIKRMPKTMRPFFLEEKRR